MKLGERAHQSRQTRRAAAFVASLLKTQTAGALSQTQHSARRSNEGSIDCLAYIGSNFDHNGAVRRHCFRDDLGRLRCVRDRIALRAECAGKGRKIGVRQARIPRTFRKCSFLMRTDGAVRLVVGDHDLYVEPAGNGSCQLVPGHQETAVAAQRDHLTIRMMVARAQQKPATPLPIAPRAEPSSRADGLKRNMRCTQAAKLPADRRFLPVRWQAWPCSYRAPFLRGQNQSRRDRRLINVAVPVVARMRSLLIMIGLKARHGGGGRY